MTATEITETITSEDQIVIISAIFDQHFRSAFAHLTRWQEQNPRRSAYNDMFMCNVARTAGLVTSVVNCMPGTEYLDDEKVTRHARRNAEALTAEYAAKVEGKAEGMVDVKVSRMAADGSFVVTGTKSGHAVEIRQSVVTKTSSKGKWFHQFPALVYIDSKKSTEKALKAL